MNTRIRDRPLFDPFLAPFETDPFFDPFSIHPFEVCLGTATRKAVLVEQSGLSFHTPSHNGFWDPLKAHSEPALIAHKAPPRPKTTHTNPRRALFGILSLFNP